METLLLIDANSFIHRAFHALPAFTGPGGEPTGALYGFTNTILKVTDDLKPEYIAAAFDRPEPTFRKEMFSDYKAHRPKAPNELRAQIIEAHKLLQSFGISIFEYAGFEADDIIGTLTEKFKHKNELKIIILTGDLDTLQLVEGEKIAVYVPKKGISELAIYNEQAVKERFGINPKQLSDYKALVGDASDNIPGIPGIGPKTAATFLNEFQNIETLYKNLNESRLLIKNIAPWREQAFLSKDLATLREDVPIKEMRLEELKYNIQTPELIKYFNTLGFQSLIKRLVKYEGEKQDNNESVIDRETECEIEIIPDVEYAKKHHRILESHKIKIAYDWKQIIKEMENVEVREPIFDVKIAGWLIDSDNKDVSLAMLAKRFLNQELKKTTKELLLRELYFSLHKEIKKQELLYVFEKIEMPLVKVLAVMENWGINIDLVLLKSLEQKLKMFLADLEQKIYKEADCVFNINSPKQLSRILFDKLKIGRAKKKTTKTGHKSTSEDVLLELKNEHPVVLFILEYRQAFKLVSTYIEPLTVLGTNGCIHTSFVQTGTTTGRLVSSKPNLQNIPQDSKWAKDLRDAFIPSDGCSFLSFDYSQLELRLLAHITQDEELQKAFLAGLDVHCLTASKIFRVPLEKVSVDMRRLGKTLNFGIIYGMGAKSFSRTSCIPLQEARSFIDEYFMNFPKIKVWHKQVEEEAKASGYIKNLNGRRRWFVLDSFPGSFRESEMRRIVINMPIQSLGADIIKLGMIQSYEFMKDSYWLGQKMRLLLSIHDELLFEVSDDILKIAAKKIKNILENVYKFIVPLVVDVKYGKKWGTMKEFVF